LVHSLEKRVHEREHLQNQLILSQIISTFVDELQFMGIASRKAIEGELKWSHSTAEDSTIGFDRLQDSLVNVQWEPQSLEQLPIDFNDFTPQLFLLLIHVATH